MKDITNANFGLLIAYVIPGALLLWGLEPYSATIQHWLAQSSLESPSVAGFLYVTVTSIGLGLLASTMRWLIIDRVLERSGVARRPKLTQLSRSTEAFDRLVEFHYRYYQSHANSLVAIWFAGPMRWIAEGFHVGGLILLVIVSGLLWLGAMNTLENYREGLKSILEN